MMMMHQLTKQPFKNVNFVMNNSLIRHRCSSAKIVAPRILDSSTARNILGQWKQQQPETIFRARPVGIYSVCRKNGSLIFAHDIQIRQFAAIGKKKRDKKGGDSGKKGKGDPIYETMLLCHDGQYEIKEPPISDEEKKRRKDLRRALARRRTKRVRQKLPPRVCRPPIPLLYRQLSQTKDRGHGHPLRQKWQNHFQRKIQE